jgi:hypothetical protein
MMMLPIHLPILGLLVVSSAPPGFPRAVSARAGSPLVVSSCSSRAGLLKMATPPSPPPTPQEPTPEVKEALAEYKYHLSLDPTSSECGYALVKLQAICNSYYASESKFIVIVRTAAIALGLNAVSGALGEELFARLQALGLF